MDMGAPPPLSLLLVSLRTDRPGHVAGEVVTVVSDIGKVGTMDRHDMLILDVPLTQEQARTLYLRNGVPQANIDAALAARLAWRAATEATPPVQADIDATRAAYTAAAAAANPDLFPARKRILDVTKVPQTIRDRIAAKRAKIAEKRAEANAEGHRRFMALIRLKFGPLTAEEEARTQHEWLEMLARRWAAAKAAGASEAVLGRLDAIADRLRADACAGEQSVLQPALALLPDAAVLTLTATQLQNATVVQ